MLGDGIIEVDHPSFNDPEYRKRRIYIGNLAMSYKMDESIPYLKYSKDENGVWGVVYRKLREV